MPDAMRKQSLKLWLKNNKGKTEADAPPKLQAGEPSSSDVHVPGLADGSPAKKTAKPNNAFRKLTDLLRGSGKHTDEEVQKLVATARGHAGGKASAAARASTEVRVMTPVSFQYGEDGAPPEWIPILPQPGNYTHPTYGEIPMPVSRLDRFVANFKEGVYQNPIPIDGEHQTKLSGAMGWIRELRTNEDGSVDARADWTDRGKAMLADQRYKYISPEWYDEWSDPATGQPFSDVLIGCAMTTRPYFKPKSLRPLAAGEFAYMDDMDADCEPEGQEDTDSLSDIVLDMVFDGLTDEEIMALVKGSADLARAGMAAYTRAMGPGAAIDAQQYKEHARGGGTMADAETTKTTEGGAPGTVALTEDQSRLFREQADQIKALTEENARTKAAAEASAAEAKAASERLTLLEVAGRTKRFTDEVMGRSEQNGLRWFGEVDKHVPFMEKLASAFGEDSDELKQYIENQRAHAAQLSEAAVFSAPQGRSSAGGGDGSALAKIEGMAAALVKDNPKLSMAEAISEVALRPENAQLYKSYTEELRSR